MVNTRRTAKQDGENGGVSLQSRKFEGVCVVFTGIDKNLQKKLAEIVTRHAGTIRASVNQLTTHLIARKMTDPKCFEASKNHIPIMKVDWIFAVKDAPGDVDAKSSNFIAEYSFRIFENVLFCVSKCPSEMQVKIQNAIVTGGGDCSRNLLLHKTDVVIVPTEISEKFKVARQCKIPTVTPAWVFSSEAEGRLLPLTTFQPEKLPCSSTQIAGASGKGPTPCEISAIIQSAAPAAIMPTAISAPNPRNNSVQDCPSAMTTQDDTSIQMKTMEISHILFVGICFIVRLESEEESRRVSKLIKDNGGEILLDVGQVKDGTIAILPPVYSERLANGILKSFTKYWVEEVCQRKCLIDLEVSLHHRTFQVDENRKFLSGFAVFIAGYSEPIKDYLGVLATHSGANIQKSLNVKSKPGRQRINYVICNDTSDKSVEIARNSGIPIVIEDWLVACWEKNALLDHANFLLSSENNSVDDISTKVATPECSQKESSPLQDASSFVNHSASGTIVPGTPESSVSLFSPRPKTGHQKHEDSGNFHHKSAGQSDAPDNQHGSQAKLLKKHRNATSSSGRSSGTSGYTSSKSADRSS